MAGGNGLYEGELLAAASGPALRPGGLDLTARALEVCAFPPGAKLLDVGCGRGASVAWLRRQGLDAAGIDRSATLVAAGQAAGLPVARAEAETLPTGDDFLDGLLCECVLSLMAEPARALAEFARVLRPGGRLILSDLYRRAAVDQGLLPERRQLEAWLAAAGFTLRVWEDHTPRLAELAAQLLLTHGSLEAICAALPGDGWVAERPGYFLLVAEKTGTGSAGACPP